MTKIREELMDSAKKGWNSCTFFRGYKDEMEVLKKEGFKVKLWNSEEGESYYEVRW